MRRERAEGYDAPWIRAREPRHSTVPRETPLVVGARAALGTGGFPPVGSAGLSRGRADTLQPAVGPEHLPPVDPAVEVGVQLAGSGPSVGPAEHDGIGDTVGVLVREHAGQASVGPIERLIVALLDQAEGNCRLGPRTRRRGQTDEERQHRSTGHGG